MTTSPPHRFTRGRPHPPTLARVADEEILAKVFHALANDIRRGILGVLHDWGGLMRSSDIALRFEGVCTWQAVSRHLRVLSEAGLLDCCEVPNGRVYSVNPDRLRAVPGRWISLVASPVVWKDPEVFELENLEFDFDE